MNDFLRRYEGETIEKAEASKDRLREEESSRDESEEPERDDERAQPTPLAEKPGGPPRPRR